MEDKSGRESKKRLWDTGRYLVGCLLLLCMAGKSYAQGDDFGVWTSAEVKKKIFSGFDASLEGEFRTRDGLQTVERWSGSAGVSYKMFRWLKASAGYTFIHYYHPMEVTKKGNYIPEYWQNPLVHRTKIEIKTIPFAIFHFRGQRIVSKFITALHKFVHLHGEKLFGRQTALLAESLGGTVDTFHSFANQ